MDEAEELEELEDDEDFTTPNRGLACYQLNNECLEKPQQEFEELHDQSRDCNLYVAGTGQDSFDNNNSGHKENLKEDLIVDPQEMKVESCIRSKEIQISKDQFKIETQEYPPFKRKDRGQNERNAFSRQEKSKEGSENRSKGLPKRPRLNSSRFSTHFLDNRPYSFYLDYLYF